LIDWVQRTCHWVLEIVKRSDDIKGFKALPHRWIVERTFAWLGHYRRLSQDYEYLRALHNSSGHIMSQHVCG
jgi:putative transposase